MASSGPTLNRRTCGFGPGHHAHPVHAIAAALEVPEAVRIGEFVDGMLTVFHTDGSRSTWWHHDEREFRNAAHYAVGMGFLHDGSLLRLGGAFLSVSRTPSPCWNAGAHLDPNHVAWAGPPVIPPEPTGKLHAKRSDHPEPGHELPFWRLDAALAKGPGTVVDRVELTGGGSLVLEVGNVRLRRSHHNPARIEGALLEALDGIPYRQPPGPPRYEPVQPIEERGTVDYGDAPPMALLDEEILRIGDCYFWLARNGFGRSCGYTESPAAQYHRQRMMALYMGVQFRPAMSEPARLEDIARVKGDSIRVRVGDLPPSGDAPAGVLLPTGGAVRTPEGAAELAGRMVEAVRPMLKGFQYTSGAGIALYRGAR